MVTYELARLVVGFVWLQFEFGGTRSAATPDAVLPGLAVCRLLRQVAIFGGRYIIYENKLNFVKGRERYLLPLARLYARRFRSAKTQKQILVC